MKNARGSTGAEREPQASPRAQRVAVVVAHPDDEVLWCGGLLLSHPEWSTFIAVLCRGSDADRSPRFKKVRESLGVQGAIGDLDDGPDQEELSEEAVEGAVLALLPETDYDLILTHSPRGEYTRHRRHEETARAVLSLWNKGALTTKSLWLFAYEDGHGAYLPRADKGETLLRLTLSEQVAGEKYRLISEVYGFDEGSWEARTSPREEAFRYFVTPASATGWFGDNQPS